MSRRPQIKSKVVKATLANKDVLDMFHGVLGTSEGSAQLPITYPKYLRIAHHTDRFLRLLELTRDSTPLGLFPGPHSHLAAYVAALRAQHAQSFSAPSFEQWLGVSAAHMVVGLPPPDGAEAYDRVPAETVARFNDVFAAIKKCSLVNTVIVACSHLVARKKALQDEKALNDRFLTKGAGTTFSPLPDLPQLNFKQVYVDERLSADDRRFLMAVLHKMYTIGHDVYEAVSAPDVDVNEFAEVIMSSIGEVQKFIPRCDEAFKKIASSVDLLKGNFGDYYKDFTASGNPTIIMENFVLDVSKDTKASPKVTAQFRKIITHYRKLASQQASNPKLKSLFSQVDANFQELEKQSAAADGESSEDSSEDEAAPPAPATQAAPPAASLVAPSAAPSAALAPGVPPAHIALGPAEAEAGPEGPPRSKAARRKAARRAAREAAPRPHPPAPEPGSDDGPSLAEEFDLMAVADAGPASEPGPAVAEASPNYSVDTPAC